MSGERRAAQPPPPPRNTLRPSLALTEFMLLLRRGLAIVKMSKQSAPKRGGSARKANRKPRAGSGGTPMGGAARRAQDRPLHSRREFDRSGLSPPARLPASGRNPRLVFIWDMDETLIVFQSLVSGTYMKARQMNPKQHALGKKLGLQVCALPMQCPCRLHAQERSAR